MTVLDLSWAKKKVVQANKFLKTASLQMRTQKLNSVESIFENVFI
jgi:hypothetical protein